MKKAITALLLVALLFCVGCGRLRPRIVSGISGRIVEVYSKRPETSQAREERLFRVLESLDPAKAELCGQIMDFWKACDSSPIFENAPSGSLPEDDSLCLVVLGFKLNDDGTMQDELIGRLEAALRCAGQHPNACVLCAGGGTAVDAPDVTEAGLMGAWLLEHGLDESRLLLEDRSENTVENALFGCELIRQEKPGVRSLAIITSDYHTVRASVIYESVLLMTNEDDGAEPIHVVSHVACSTAIGTDPEERTRLAMQLKSLLQ